MRGNLFQINGKKSEPLVLPEATGPPVTLSEKVYVPIKEHPDVSVCMATPKFREHSSGAGTCSHTRLFMLNARTIEGAGLPGLRRLKNISLECSASHKL